MKFFIKSFIIFFILINTIIFTVVFYPVPKALQSLNPNDTFKIYDRNNVLLYEVLNKDTGRQTFIPFAEIPQTVKDAFISVEDRSFYENPGVDFSAIIRAIWQNVTAGEIVSGGSTITQQVVRNIVGAGMKRTFPQKMKESILAIKISRLMDKDQIFEAYLNSVYFGGLAYGIESASWQYFGKSSVNLDLAESAFLAGLPQSPNGYYPFKNFDSAKNRQEDVLLAMLSNGKISKQDFELAKSEEIILHKSDVSKKAPHFVDHVIQSLQDGDSEIPKKIVTTLDYGIQQKTETILQSDLSFLKKYNIQNAAAVVMDVKTGGIIAMVGSADYGNDSIDGKVNVTTSLRQPGSSIKPLIYAAAIEKGWKPDTIIADEPVKFETSEGLPYEPKNFDMAYHGNVTLAQALAQSLNIPAVKTLNYVGIAPFLGWAKKFGITTFDQTPDHYGLSLALGSAELKLLELTGAYTVFANNGKRADIRFTDSVASVSLRDVIKAETADMISAMLSDNNLRMFEFGEENPLNLPFRVAGKTGTTRDFKDNWTIGFTDDYAVGVWVGNAGGEKMQGVSGISGAGPIFSKIMSMLHESTGTVLTKGSDVDLGIYANKHPSITNEQLPMTNDQSSISDNQFHIITPFANDLYLFQTNKPAGYQKIKLEASQSAKWSVDGRSVGEGKSVLWELERGQHLITAVSSNGEERSVGINVK